MRQLVMNCLLHLYLDVASSHGYVPMAKRNTIIIKFLKTRLAQSAYQPVKKSGRTLLAQCRRANANAEKELLTLYQTYHPKSELNDCDRLYALLSKMDIEYGIQSDLVQDSEAPKVADVLYLLPEHIEHCFDDASNQIAPISVLLESRKHREIMRLVEGAGAFKVGLVEENQQAKQAHYQLHPATVTL
nr:DUF2913 family protein [Motilimonas eburnea]